MLYYSTIFTFIAHGILMIQKKNDPLIRQLGTIIGGSLLEGLTMRLGFE
jgi:hypothetical protein